MHDHEAIQGLWKHIAHVSRGQKAWTSTTHYVFSGTRQQELRPDWVDDGTFVTTFALRPETEPRQIVLTNWFRNRHDPTEVQTRVQRGLYRLEGDRLQLCLSWGQDFPARFGDDETLITLQRDHGPPPPQRQPSGTPHLVDELLGRLTWDDNLDWYSRRFPFQDAHFELTLSRDEQDDLAPVLNRARAWMQNLDLNLSLARAFATEQLLELTNDTWLGEDQQPLTSAEFLRCLTPQSVGFHGLGGSVYFFAGDLFGGDVIVVRFDEHERFVDTEVAG